MSEADQDTTHFLSLSQTGTAEDVSVFLDRYRGKLKRMVQLRLNPRLQGRVDASDIVQDAYVEAARVMDDYLEKRPLPIYLWLRHITNQQLIVAHRKHLQSQKRSLDREQVKDDYAMANSLSLVGMLAGAGDTPSRIVVNQEAQQQLRAALDELPDLDREVLVLRHFEHLSRSETAKLLDIPVETVKKRYFRALQKLRKALPGLDTV